MSYRDDDLTKALAGRQLASLVLSDDGTALTVAFVDGTTLTVAFVDGTTGTLETYGDCCSQSWIEHLTVPPDIAGATVTSVKDSDGDDATDEQVAESAAAGHEYIDVLKVYQTSIVTDRGEVVIEYRNDSNGYYGGWVEWVPS